jgi:hypothetical protein
LHCASTGQICRAFKKYVYGNSWKKFPREPSASIEEPGVDRIKPKKGGRRKLSVEQRKRKRRAYDKKRWKKKKLAARKLAGSRSRDGSLAPARQQEGGAVQSRARKPPAAVDYQGESFAIEMTSTP